MLSGKTGVRRRHQARMICLDDSGERRRAAVLGARVGGAVESRKLAWRARSSEKGQPNSRGELVEQRRLIEASHHNDPIDDATLSPEANPTIRGADQRSDLEIEVRSRAAVERELSLAGCAT